MFGKYFNLKGKMKGHIPLFHKRKDGKGNLCLSHLRGEVAIECWLGTIFPAQLTLIISTATEEITDQAPIKNTAVCVSLTSGPYVLNTPS